MRTLPASDLPKQIGSSALATARECIRLHGSPEVTMPRINLQFHAEGEELLSELLPRWLSEIDFFYVIRRRDGSIVDRNGNRGPLAVHGDYVDVAEVFFRLSPFVATEGNDLDFLRGNSGFLVASIPHVVNGCLRESAIGSMADDPAAMGSWRNVVRDAKRDLLKGAIAVGLNGERRLDAEHRYSVRAADLARGGIRMLAIAGDVAYELGESADARDRADGGRR